MTFFELAMKVISVSAQCFLLLYAGRVTFAETRIRENIRTKC